MKHTLCQSLFISALIFICGLSSAQVLQPIQWSYTSKAINDSVFELRFKAVTEKEWHLYSQYTPDGGPLPTVFEFKPSNDYKLLGKVAEPKAKVVYEEVFGVDVHYFEAQQVLFVQKVQLLSQSADIKGVINGMTCKDDVGCIPFDEMGFGFQLSRAEKSDYGASTDTLTEKSWTQTETTQPTEAVQSNCKDLKIEGLSIEAKAEEKQSYWIIFLLGFGGGLLALLTPCVFPMIPLTVSFFTKNAGSRRKSISMSVAYGLSITAIYVLLAVPFLVAKVPPDTLNEIATSVWLNLLFFVIFIVFAFSFFGYYEITMPSWLTNKADSASSVGGFIGIFFMAITLALVSFSCTGPILGSFLAGTLAANPDPYNLLFVMLGFGLALGLPFSLFALFPGMLKSLPKSGGWLNSVKVILGFLELGLAMKFLSNADLVEQWGLLKRETFLIIWALIGFAMAAYLLGWIKFPHDTRKPKLGPVRLSLAGLFALTGIYFASGLFGNSLSLISGFPPPMFYSYRAASAHGGSTHEIKGLFPETDYYVALEKAKAQNKPLLIDFTGWACVNCRRMEENVWVDEEVNRIMREDFVLVSLYVDEKMNLPESEKFTSCLTGKRIQTVGNKWSNFQLVNFNSNSQPQYVALSPEGRLLSAPVGYTSRDEYLDFLNYSKQKYSAR